MNKLILIILLAAASLAHAELNELINRQRQGSGGCKKCDYKIPQINRCGSVPVATIYHFAREARGGAGHYEIKLARKRRGAP